jgi:gamma-glutamyltranspeptidase/glutathione hydrolase
MTRRVAVAASNSLAADAGVRLAAVGGNAVDAALAAVFVSMVCEPGVCSLAGGAFVTVGPADGSDPVTVDGNVEMPGRGLPPERFGRGVVDVTTGYGGGITMTVGHGSVATPGALAALAEASARFGQAPWREVLAPAVAAARDGFPLGAASAYYLDFVHDQVFGWHPDSYAALHDANGRLLRPGDLVRVRHLAESLSEIAEEGVDAFYRGEVARRIAADMAAHDGLVTAADLAAYRPVTRPALRVELGGWRLGTNPPPAIGGVTLAAMLQLMAGRPAADWTAEDVAHLIGVQDAVLRYRVEHLDVAEDRVAAARRLLDSVADGSLLALRTSPSTVHVSAVDDAGTTCAVTSSAGYGSGVMTPGTGLWLNNCLGEPELNRRGLHALPPGERLPSNMAPTVGRRRDGAVLAIGSPGADRISTALLQVLASFATGGLPLDAAITRPRLHVRHVEDGVVIEHEAGLPLPPLTVPTCAHPELAMFFGGVGAALRLPGGDLVAAADPRRAAAVGVGPDA